MKYLKGKVHFKLTNTLWLAALQLIAAADSDLFGKIATAAGLQAVSADELTAGSGAGRQFALSYSKVLNPKEGNMAAELKDFLLQNKEEYAKYVTKNVKNFIDKI